MVMNIMVIMLVRRMTKALRKRHLWVCPGLSTTMSAQPLFLAGDACDDDGYGDSDDNGDSDDTNIDNAANNGDPCGDDDDIDAEGNDDVANKNDANKGKRATSNNECTF